MLFTGEYEYTIDAKQRLAIPAEIRSRLDPVADGEAFYLVPGENGALWMWPERAFERMVAATDRSLLRDEDMMDFDELFFSQAARLEMDKSGRVNLPARLLESAAIGQTVMILGVKDHLELRDPAEWQTRREEKLAQKAEIMRRGRRALRARLAPEDAGDV